MIVGTIFNIAMALFLAYVQPLSHIQTVSRWLNILAYYIESITVAYSQYFVNDIASHIGIMKKYLY